MVVPHAGTWIEIEKIFDDPQLTAVVPHAGTWIEIRKFHVQISKITSFPTRERGLKFLSICLSGACRVVPHAGTWIEIATEKESW